MRRAIIYIDENYAEFGEISESHDNIRILYEGRLVWGKSYKQLENHLGFDYLRGCYVIGNDTNQHNFPFGRDSFPYNLSRMTYNTKFEEQLFKGKQNILNNNSIVAKFIYRNISLLFTGDIEEIAEKKQLDSTDNDNNGNE